MVSPKFILKIKYYPHKGVIHEIYILSKMLIGTKQKMVLQHPNKPKLKLMVQTVQDFTNTLEMMIKFIELNIKLTKMDLFLRFELFLNIF